MNAPYYRDWFLSYLSVHAKTMKELNRTFAIFEEVKDTIYSLYKRGGKQSSKKAGEFVVAVVKNNKLKVGIVFNGKYLIDYDSKKKTYKTEF